MPYQIMTGTTLDELCKAVAAEIEKGWAPCGGVSVVMVQQDHYIYHQAMTKIG